MCFEHTRQWTKSKKKAVILRILVINHNFQLTTITIIYRPIPDYTILKMDAKISPETPEYQPHIPEKNNFEVIYNYAGTEVLTTGTV